MRAGVAAGATGGLEQWGVPRSPSNLVALAVAVLDLEGTGKRVPVVPVVTPLGAETAGTVQIRRLMADAIGPWFREGATGTTRMWGPQR